MSLESIDPATGEALRTYEEMDPDEVVSVVDRVDHAQQAWAGLPLDDRAARMRAVARLLERRRDELAALATAEMGKPIAQSRSEVEKCTWVCDHYAAHAARDLEPESVDSDARKSFVAFRPLGVVLAIMPWNFPYWQVFRFAAPGLMAGNGAVLKHAGNVTGCALAIEALFRDAGFPEHLFRTLRIGSDQVDAVLEHPRIRAATLTGSVRAGRAVAGKAGSLVKKTVLELGGSDPYVVLADADVEMAAETCAASRLINSGQSCIAAKRFIVVDEIREPFVEKFLARMRAAKVGDPRQETTEVGPQARHDLRDTLHDQVERSVDDGARVLLGGDVPEGPGAFYPPTVLAGVRPGMAAFDEETFGPVAAIVPARDEEEALSLANRSAFGLGAAVFTRDVERGERIAAERLDAGCCFVNAFVKSDPRLPFGGVKESGYGRELGRFGIREFVNVKTVYVA